MSRDVDLVQMVADLRAEMRTLRLEMTANSGVPPGLVMLNPMKELPAGGWLWANGAAVSRTTYPRLFEAVMPTLGTFTCTIASPTELTFAADHGLVIGDKVAFTTTGALPTGLSVNTVYYVKTVPTSTKITLGTSRTVSPGSVSGTVNTSGSQSGVHSARHCPWGIGNGTTTFNVPNFQGATPVGMDAFGGATAAGLLDWLDVLGATGGEQTHLLSGAESGTSAHGHNDTFSVGLGTLDATVSGGTHTHPIGQSGSNNIYEGQGYPDGGSFTGSPSKQEPGSGTSKTSGNNSTMSFSASVTGAPSISGSVSNSSAANASSAHNNMQPTVLTAFVVKT